MFGPCFLSIPRTELSPSLSLIYQNLLMGTLLATGLVFRRPVKWQKQAPRGQLTFEQKDGFPDYLSPKARGCGQTQPTSGTPETPARPESHPEPSWDYPAWQGEIFVCPSRTPRGQGLSLLHLCFPHFHLSPVQCRVWPTVCAQEVWINQRLGDHCLRPFLACHQTWDLDPATSPAS